jgi:hypothetical protein
MVLKRPWPPMAGQAIFNEAAIVAKHEPRKPLFSAVQNDAKKARCLTIVALNCGGSMFRKRE